MTSGTTCRTCGARAIASASSKLERPHGVQDARRDSERARLPRLHRERRGAELRELLDHVAVEPLADRRQQHDGGYADADPERRERAAHAVRRYGLRDQPNEVVAAHCTTTFHQRVDGIEIGRAPRRHDAEHEPAQDRNRDGRQRGPRRRAKVEDRKREAQQPRAAHADRDPDRRAEQRQARGLGEKQSDDLPAARAHGLEQADLRGPLAHRDEHDVHDQHAGHDQADGGDGGEPGRDHPEDRVERRHQRILRDDRDVFFAGVARLDYLDDVAPRGLNRVAALGLGENPKHAGRVEDLLRVCDRQDHCFVDVEPAREPLLRRARR